MAIKLNSMTEREIESIAEAFAEYQYEDGEEGLFFLFPDQEAIKIYLRAFVRAGVKAGWVYTGERREGYLMISDSRSKMAQEGGLPCILDTDGLRKRDKYIHLGMEPAGIRKIGPCAYLYDLIKPMDKIIENGRSK